MSDTLEELSERLVSYYNYHKVDKMVENHPGFVVDDFTRLLKELEKELALGSMA